jgi:non-canonical (house-cleaning) NTP pyrophosphatase
MDHTTRGARARAREAIESNRSELELGIRTLIPRLICDQVFSNSNIEVN